MKNTSVAINVTEAFFLYFHVLFENSLQAFPVTELQV